MPRYRYVPILRAKAGEAAALESLTPDAKARIYPLLQLLKATPKGVADRIGAAWQGRAAMADGTHFAAVGGDPDAWRDFFRKLGKAGVNVVPVLSPAAPAAHLAAARRLIDRYAPGAALRVGAAAVRRAADIARTNGLDPAATDLIVDLAAIGAASPDTLGLAMAAELARLDAGWRSVTLAASAAPKDFSALAAGVNVVPRNDFALWLQVAGEAGRRVDFGDYATVHPDLSDVPGAAMANATVSVRYTRDDDWLFVKGRRIGGPAGRGMEPQYRAHARTLVGHRGFGGVDGCAADARIRKIAAGPASAGNRTTWVTLAVNRHLSLVADRLD